jgi:quercetin dioxygenase-like cupin family protein
LSSLSISSLKAIAEALNVPLSRFFFVADNPSYVVKLHNRRKFQIEGSKVVYSSLSGPLEDKSLEPLIVELPPYYEGPPPFAHEGEEFVYVLEGTLSLIIQEKEYQLEPGDSVHFASVVPHTWKNNNSILSKVIWIGTPRMLGGDEHKL